MKKEANEVPEYQVGVRRLWAVYDFATNQLPVISQSQSDCFRLLPIINANRKEYGLPLAIVVRYDVHQY